MNLSIFDLDHTLLKKNSSVEFCKYLYKKKKLSFFSVFQSSLYYISHVYLLLSLEELHSKIFKKILQGMCLKDLEKEAAIFVRLYLEDLIYLPASEKLKAAQGQGHFTVILSSSPSFLVGVIAREFQVDEWGASEYLADESMCLCRISSVMQGEGKALYVQEVAKRLSILKKDITAYSDSHLDLPLFMASGTAISVNPNSQLRKLSRRFGWQII